MRHQRIPPFSKEQLKKHPKRETPDADGAGFTVVKRHCRGPGGGLAPRAGVQGGGATLAAGGIPPNLPKENAMNEIQQLCDEAAGTNKVLQGNIAFAVGCVRAGIHAADGYPGTPSTEAIDKGLSQAQDRITVGWSVNEAVAVSVGVGHAMAGRDCVVTMKIPGLYQACDAFTSVSCYMQPKGALIYYIASDFTPSSTQHVIDPRYLFKSCFVPVFEPRTHQEMHEAAGLAADISRTHRTPVVILAAGSSATAKGWSNSPNSIRARSPKSARSRSSTPCPAWHASPTIPSWRNVCPDSSAWSRNRPSTSTIRERDGAG